MAAGKQAAHSSIVKTRLKQLITTAELSDGYIPVCYRYHAAHTGRFGGSNRINLSNLPRISPEKNQPSDAIRLGLTAPNLDSVLVVVDSSNIEARVLAWISDNQELLEQFRAGDDVYSKFAEKIYHKPINKKDNPFERFVGKTCTLGLGFGMSWPKFQHTMALGTMGQAVEFSDEEASRIVGTWRHINAPVVDYWSKMDLMIGHMATPFGISSFVPIKDKCLTFKRRAIELPSKRELRYPYLSIQEDETGYCFGRQPRISLYGGRLTENIVQALARDIVMYQMVSAIRLGPFRQSYLAHPISQCGGINLLFLRMKNPTHRRWA